ncbi:phosphate ABC transporter permease PstA [Campylobacter lari]|uniref:phosphate ABC transporter permease PstA n=1 Tax=Campylobacter lari TaxID=201 RepID=UPI000874ACA2|nr:phosphate ABC transporter permease PstA [Campylobacter lari]EAH4936082.1 phosphate ABC transporter permease PstA [Campylobacter lari]EAH7836973.1 phosphate ABC transporter permease PstA [Campylobacter lari]EAI0281971.1 phosphate ABC transporter permease PstA [Campylobacter lari]EAI0925093.1 phosphate ABC transporter permease PstA [Campylobacter lari]EAI2016558.1 phosphate ABC transporter permease PstA [Campylobacter lari]
MKKLFKQRKKASKNFKRFCKIGLYINLIFLCVFLSSVGYLGIGAFKQTYIYTQADRNSPSYELLSRAEQRKIRTGQIKEKSWLLANSEVDQYMKKNYNKLSDEQKKIVDELVQKQEIKLSFNTNFFLNGDSKSPENSGIFASVIGTLLVMLVCMAVSIPIGVGAAIYLEEFAPQNVFTHFIEVCINNLASIPSILFGLLGLGVFINLFGMPRSSALVGGLTLAIMSLPIIIVSTKAALKSVDINMKNAAYALGMTKIQMIKGIMLPLAMPMILTGSILTLAGAIGETAPLMIIGMIAFIPDVANSVFAPTSVLPAQIFSWSAMPERAFLERTAAGIIVLLSLLVILNLAAILLRRYFQGKLK